MIYTVTFNPSLDYIIGIDNFETGKVNRTQEEKILPGGKGINVSIVLKNLGIESIPLGFMAGFTGLEIERKLLECEITGEFIPLKQGNSRINVKLQSFETTSNGVKKISEETEINGKGPAIDDDELSSFYSKLDKLKEGDILVLAGGIPLVLPSTIYSDIMLRLKEKNIMVVVDATNDLLVNVLKYHPFLVKPNNHELGEIFGVELKKTDDVIKYARKLQEMGAVNVLVSMAGDGAVLIDEYGNAYTAKPPKGKVKNSVGAGDSMVAGFVYGYLTHKSYEEAFYYGIVTGSASAFSDNLATYDEVNKLLETYKTKC